VLRQLYLKKSRDCGSSLLKNRAIKKIARLRQKNSRDKKKIARLRQKKSRDKKIRATAPALS